MSAKLSLDSQYLDNSQKCKILQKSLISACRYYISKIEQNKINLGLCKVNWNLFSFYSSGFHSDISKAKDMIEKLESHVDAQALKPILNMIPHDIGNFHLDSMKVILARSIFDILNMSIPNEKDKLLYHWHDPICNRSQVEAAVKLIRSWIDGPVSESSYQPYLDLIALDESASKHQD